MSSRNAYLSQVERQAAPSLYQSLRRVADAIESGATDYQTLTAVAREELLAAGLAPDYVEVRRAADLAQPTTADDMDLIVLAAAHLGQARLIDNLRVMAAV